MRYQMKLKLTHDEVRVLVFALNELRNTLIAENRYTDPVDEILAKVSAGESFKWGAITGVLAGGATEAITIKKATDATNGIITLNSKIPDPRTSELRA